MNTLDTFRLKQYSHESKSWERLLYFFKQENAFFKIYLSEVVDNITREELLIFAEYFQNKFISNDSFIDTLLQNIHEQERNFKLEKQEKLCEEMITIEKDFHELKDKFNEYLFLLYN